MQLFLSPPLIPSLLRAAIASHPSLTPSILLHFPPPSSRNHIKGNWVRRTDLLRLSGGQDLRRYVGGGVGRRCRLGGHGAAEEQALLSVLAQQGLQRPQGPAGGSETHVGGLCGAQLGRGAGSEASLTRVKLYWRVISKLLRLEKRVDPAVKPHSRATGPTPYTRC